MGDVGELVERLRKAAPGTTLSMQVNDLSALREAADLIESLNSRLAAMTKAAAECANDLEASVKAEYVGTLGYPSRQLKFERDMEPVHAVRRLLGCPLPALTGAGEDNK